MSEKPMAFRRYAVRFTLIPTGLALSAMLIFGPRNPGWNNAEFPTYLLTILVLPFSIAVLSLLVYAAICSPARRKRASPWWKILFMDSTDVLIDRSLDRPTPRDAQQPFFNRPLLRFGPRVVWVLLALSWLTVLCSAIYTIITVAATSDFSDLAARLGGGLASIVILIYLTAKARDRQRNSWGRRK